MWKTKDHLARIFVPREVAEPPKEARPIRPFWEPASMERYPPEWRDTKEFQVKWLKGFFAGFSDKPYVPLDDDDPGLPYPVIDTVATPGLRIK